MIDGEFRLNNYAFGTIEHDVVILEDGLDTGSPEVRTQDTELPAGDGLLFGRDYLTAPTWAFTVGVRHDSDVHGTISQLASIWRNKALRTEPGVLAGLQFRRGGKEYIAYGRPRRFAVSASPTADNEWQVVEMDFKLIDPFVYSNTQNSLQMGLLEIASTGGLVLPAALPIELGRSTSDRKGIVSVQGWEPTPLKVVIKGPTAGGVLSNPIVTAPGFNIELNTIVSRLQTIIIDTRTRTVTRNGISIAGALSRTSRLNTKLEPGNTEFTFKGTDPSNTSEVTFYWRNAEYSI